MVTQMQYLSWPDHGTPDDSTQFVEFVEEVRDMRAKSVQARQDKALTSTVDNIEVHILQLYTFFSSLANSNLSVCKKQNKKNKLLAAIQ